MNFWVWMNCRIILQFQSLDSTASLALIVLLQLEPLIGQFCLKILMNHPHFMLAIIEQQLEQLQVEHYADNYKE